MKNKLRSIVVATFSASNTLVWSSTTLNPDGFSTDTLFPFPAGAGTIAAGFGNQSSPGNHGYGAAGGNLLSGSGNFATNSDSSLSVGISNNLNYQEGSMAIGWENQMNFTSSYLGESNIILGYFNTVNPGLDQYQWGCILIGDSNQTSAPDCWVMGRGNTGQTETVTLGTYSTPVNNASLIVGNGSGGGNSPHGNGLVVFKNGLVDIPGSLSVGGSNALTQNNAGSFMQSQGFINTSYLTSNNYLKKFNGTNSSASSLSLLSLGNDSHATEEGSISIGNGTIAGSLNSVALGSGSNANGEGAVALGGCSVDGKWALGSGPGWASGDYSIAMNAISYSKSGVAIGGYDETVQWANEVGAVGATAIGGATNQAYGDYSYAMGWNSITIGKHSFSMGHLTRSSAYEFVMGSKNVSANNQMPNSSNDQWIENGALFELGNGKPIAEGGSWEDYSNAITTLKNGQTTLTNKAWKADSAVEPTAENSQGEALVVEGHTRLKGKVVIEQPQGDISMGIYGAN